VGSYWQLPERLYDDPEELTGWARAALAAAQRAALASVRRHARRRLQPGRNPQPPRKKFKEKDGKEKKTSS